MPAPTLQRFDPEALRDRGDAGHDSGLGEWGPIVHGGAWLTVADTPVDGLIRDLDRVEGWLRDARHGPTTTSGVAARG